MEPAIAYLAQGRLFVKQPGHATREIESPFATQAMERQVRAQDVNAWKSRSGVWGNMGMAPPQWSQWEAAGGGRRPIRYASLSRGPDPGQLMYVLDMEHVSGLFQYDLTTNIERRLIHRNGFVARDLECHPGRGTLAISLSRDDGTATLALSRNEGLHWDRVTGGDSVDQSPAFVSSGSQRLVFQTASVGRNEAGLRTGLGPYSIHTLDLDNDAKVTVLLETDNSDLLLPRLQADGTLYFIRRPYLPHGHRLFSPWQVLQDIVLFPYRLLRATFYFLNFFSTMFTGKPLATSLAQRPPIPEQRFLMLWGHMVDTKHSLRRGGSGSSDGLVPKTWQLIRRSPDGSESMVGQSVLSYDIAGDGQIVYSTGRAIYVIDSTGTVTKLVDEPMVDDVVILEMRGP